MRRIILKIVLLLFPMTMLAQEITGLAGWSIYLDPGHSRTENMGIYNYSEAQKVLRVGLALRQLLLDKTDIDDVYLSRENDQISVGLSERSDEANQLGADWYHSIHSNAPSTTVNNILLLWGQYSNGNEKVPNGGKAMSDIMVQKMSAGYRIPSIGSRGDCSFYGGCNGGPYLSVNRRTTMPSELSEGGFHTNPTQNTRNMNADWKRLEAYTLFWSILQLHKIEIPRVGIVTGYITDSETGVPLNGVKVQFGDSVVVTDTFESLFNKYTTNPDLLHNGFYFFEDLPDSSLMLRIEKQGYYSDSVQVALQDDFFTFIDLRMQSNTPPQVVSTLPAVADTGVSILALVQINFNRQMDRSTVESALEFRPPIRNDFIWQNNDKRLIVKPFRLAPLTEYQLIIDTTAHDSRGVSIDGNGDGIPGDAFTFGFTTGIDDQPPSVSSVYPLNGAQGVAALPLINITFNELLDAASQDSGFFSVFERSTKEVVPGKWRFYDVDQQTVTNFFPANPLRASTYYQLKISPGLSDLKGNLTRIFRNFTFKIDDARWNTEYIDDFEKAITGIWSQPQQSDSTVGIVSDSTRIDYEQNVVNLLTGSTGALRINYGWDAAAPFHLLQTTLDNHATVVTEFDSNHTLQAFVFGDGSRNGLRFVIDENIAQTEQGQEVSPWFTLDWFGWKLVSWDLRNDGTGSGPGDGIFEGNLRFQGIQMIKFARGSEFGRIIIDDLRLVSKIPAAVMEAAHESLPEFVLYPNYPNPFNPETLISFYTRQGQSDVSLKIYNILGQQIRILANGQYNAGQYDFIWDGRDQSGRQVPTGIYIYKIEAGSFKNARQMLLMQ